MQRETYFILTTLAVALRLAIIPDCKKENLNKNNTAPKRKTEKPINPNGPL